MADYFDAKALLFDPESPLRARRVVVCVDDDAGRAMAARPVTRSPSVLTANPPIGARWTCADGRRGAGVHRRRPDGARHRVGIRLPGQYNVANCLVALAILEEVGVSPDKPRRDFCDQRSRATRRDRPRPGFFSRWSTMRTSRARCERCWPPCCGRAAGWRWCSVPVATATRASAGPMGAVAAELADLVVVTDDNPRSEDPAAIRREFWPGRRTGAAQVVEIGDRRAAIGTRGLAGPRRRGAGGRKGHETVSGGHRVRPSTTGSSWPWR